MADEPWLNIFPVFAALVYASLAGGLLRRSSSLGGMALDWVAAYVLAAGAFCAVLAANLSGWNPGGEIGVAAAGASASLGFLGAYSGVYQRYSQGWIGAPRFRGLTFAGAAALSAFGWGALVGAMGVVGDGRPAPWVVAPVVASLPALVPIAILAARRSLARGGQANTFQLFLGVLLFGSGLVAVAYGEMLIGSGLAVIGGGFTYSGAAAVVGLAPGPAPSAVAAKVEREARPRPEAGRKVRVPKGKALEITNFRDDGLPPNQGL